MLSFIQDGFCGDAVVVVAAFSEINPKSVIHHIEYLIFSGSVNAKFGLR